MEITNLTAGRINAYKKTAETAPRKKTQAPEKTINSDRIEFDFGRYLEAAKTEAAASVNADADKARLAQLAEKYSGENCPADAENTADAIFA